MNHSKNLQDFVSNARRGDTITTVRKDMKRAETYTATSDEADRENRRAVILTSTFTVADMYETRTTEGTLILDTHSIPGEVLDGVIGKARTILNRITPLTRPYATEDLLAAHQAELPTA